MTSFNFVETQITSLVGEYQHFLEVYEEACRTPYSIVISDFLVSEKVNTSLMQTFSDVVQFGLKEKQFGLLVRLLDICATFQASSADCERGLSLKMNCIKTKTCNQLQTDHLDMLMRIKLIRLPGRKLIWKKCTASGHRRIDVKKNFYFKRQTLSR